MKIQLKFALIIMISSLFGMTSFAQQPDQTKDDWENNGSGDVWLPTGNVGVGTSNPLAKMHLSGFFGPANGSNGILMTNTAGTKLAMEIGATNDSYIGTISQSYFKIRTMNQVRMTFKSTGGIGIGTETPTADLDIVGSFKLTNSSQGAGKVLTSDANGNATWQSPSGGADADWTIGASAISNTTHNVGIGTSSPTALLHIGGLSGSVNGTNGLLMTNSAGTKLAMEIGATNDSYIGTISQSYFKIRTMNQVRMTFKSTGGIGIGTETPTADLDIVGSFKLTNSSQGAGKVLTSDANGNATWQTPTVGSSDADWTIGSGIISNTSDNVGIGTSVPNSKLHVNGTMIVEGFGFDELFKVNTTDGITYAKEIKVLAQDPFPDYVFEEDYSLMKLEEVKAYVIINKHLPNVPSADEVKENGINIAEMDAILLRKIEELTLYIIHLKMELDKIKNK